jgi:hypothetical protein
LGLLILGLLAYAATAAARARLERSEALRAHLAAAVREELGVALEPEGLSLALLPPRARLHSPTLVLPAGAVLEMDRVVLSLAPLSLLRGLVEVTEIRSAGPLTLLVSDLALAADAALLLERDVAGGWRGNLSGRLSTGGSIHAEGAADASGRLTAAASFEGVEMAPLSEMLLAGEESRAEIAGAFSGTLELDGPMGSAPSQPFELALRLESPRSRIRIRDISVDGPVRIEAGSDGSTAGGGSFELDAGAARVEYAGAMQRASGSGAAVRGRFGWRDGRLALRDLALSVKAFRGEVELSGRARDSDG